MRTPKPFYVVFIPILSLIVPKKMSINILRNGLEEYEKFFGCSGYVPFFGRNIPYISDNPDSKAFQ